MTRPAATDVHELVERILGKEGQRGSVMHDLARVEIAAYAVEKRAVLVDLLQEWLRAPYFDNREEWRKWRNDFAGRVLEEIGNV